MVSSENALWQMETNTKVTLRFQVVNLTVSNINNVLSPLTIGH